MTTRITGEAAAVTGRYADLKGRRVIVTGAAQGIGLVAAQSFAAAGCDVAMLDLDAARLDSAADTLEALYPMVAIRRFPVSVTNGEAVDAALTALVSDLGSIDVLINNAGVAANAPSLDLAMPEWQRTIDINLTAVFAMCQNVARRLVDSRSCSIINIASMYGLTAGPARAAYCASKAGVIMLTQVLAVEWAALGIRVNAIAPGYVESSMTATLAADGRLDIEEVQSRTPLGRLAGPQDVSNVALFLASSVSRNITGQVIVTDGGWTADGYGAARRSAGQS